MPRFDVTIAGELNLDLILYGVPDELPAERELLADGMSLTLGGSSSIVAHNLASLGSRVGFISCIGKDQLGEIALTRLAESGVNVEKVQRADSGLSTGITVILQRDKWRNMVTYSGTIAALLFEDLDFGYLSDSRHFHLSSFYLQLGLLPRIMELFKYLKAAGLTVSLDTNDDPENQWEHGLWQALEYVDVFLPNESEAKRITGASTGDGFSFWLGHHYERAVLAHWPMKNYPNLVRRGEDFIRENGVKSVVLARFTPPTV